MNQARGVPRYWFRRTIHKGRARYLVHAEYEESRTSVIGFQLNKYCDESSEILASSYNVVKCFSNQARVTRPVTLLYVGGNEMHRSWILYFVGHRMKPRAFRCESIPKKIWAVAPSSGHVYAVPSEMLWCCQQCDFSLAAFSQGSR